ncbi:hypothetical protein EDD16DRAFT_1523291 [Pisolithus croceorrhizus]|nr:hypothetical protein EDD16DRAFT_1523291 [Pisolithus croceorrhizus]KAI6143869.1 hypothetical protein EDD17DRAFT_1515393 [Pisolithus thermaeus]
MDNPTKAKLNLLHLYLKNLPNSIPFVDPGGMSQYGFDFFVVDDEDMEDKGPVGAINCQLEIWLGHWNNGPILFTEQGPSLCKLTNLFEVWLRDLSSDPEIPILHKWLDDLIVAAENAYSSMNTKTCQRLNTLKMGCTYIDAQLRQQSNEALSNKALGPAIDSKVQMKVLGPHRAEAGPSAGMKKHNGNGMLAAVAVKEGRKKQKETGDYHIMKFIVCCGIPPTVVDSAEWKEMVAVLNPHYQPPSSTTLTKKLIVNEAAKITATINKIFAHVTTATCCTFCMELDDASQLSHTAKYILEVLEHVDDYQDQAMEFLCSNIQQYWKYLQSMKAPL